MAFALGQNPTPAKTGGRTSWPCRDSGRWAPLCADEWGAAPAFSSRALSLHRVLQSRHYRMKWFFHFVQIQLHLYMSSFHTLFPVALAWLFHSHSSAPLAAPSNGTPYPYAAMTLTPPLAHPPSPSAWAEWHAHAPLRRLISAPLWRVFVVVCAHYTEHVAQGAVSTTSRGWPL